MALFINSQSAPWDPNATWFALGSQTCRSKMNMNGVDFESPIDALENSRELEEVYSL